MNILIVDDNPDDRRLLRYLALQHHHQPVEAENGLDGLEKAKAHPPDLIISDALMPVMDGFHFLRSVKQEEALRGIPFIFYSSSYQGHRDMELALALGADAFVVKPLDPVELWATIEKLLASGRKEPVPLAPLIQEDAEYLKRYSEVVATKLEDKVRELELTLAEQRRVEEALRASETKYRIVANNTYDWEFWLSPEGQFLYSSPSCEPITAHKAEEFMADPDLMLRVVHPEDRARFEAHLQAALTGQHRPEQEVRIVRPSGEVRWLGHVCGPAHDEMGRFLGVRGSNRDITWRKHAEDALHQAHRNYVSLVSTVDGIVWEADPRTVSFTYVSPQAERLLGYPVDQWLAEPTFWPDHLHPDDREWAVKYCSDAVRDRRPHEFEYRMMAADGRVVWLRDTVTVVVEHDQPVRLWGIMVDVTSRKQAEAAVLESEVKFRSLAETLPVGILIHRGGQCCYVNTALETATGYTRAEFLGMDFSSLVDPEFRALVRDRGIARYRGDQPPEQYEFKILTKAGRELWVELRATSIIFEREPAVLAILSDVTDRRRAEAALREGEERYRKLIAASPDAITTTDLTGCVTLSSAKALEMFRIPSEERPLGRSILDWVAPEDQERARENIRVLTTTGTIPHREFTLKRDDGTTFDAEVNAALIQSASGTPLGAILITRDVTERKQAAALLRKLSRAVEQSPASIVITDPSGNIEYVNPKFTALTGYTPEEVLGHNPRVLKSGTMQAECYQQLWQTITSGLEWRGEFHNRKKNGELYWELASVSPIFDAAGNITHFLAVKEDITERRRLEEEFRQVQKLEAVGRLAGGVAHDFNNILTAILMNLSLLKEDARLAPEVVEGLDELEREANRATSLTRQLLVFSRRHAIDARPLDMNEVVHNMAKMLRRLIGEDVELLFQGPSSGLWVKADAGMLDQVLMNLCVNARDAMPDGGQLSIATRQVRFDGDRPRPHPEAASGPFVCLSVTDSGCGMDEETRKHIFEPFFTTKEVGKGTGLGLATVHSIVQQHHGWIEVESVLGRGTTFHLYFPALPEGNYTQAGPDRTPIRGGKESILVVEDDTSLRRLAALELRKLGYAVWEAANGAEASRLWEERKDQIDLLFTDMVLPGGLSGFDLARRMMQTKPSLKVLITSGYTADRAKPDMLSAEGIRYLAKPYESAMLASAVRACLD